MQHAQQANLAFESAADTGAQADRLTDWCPADWPVAADWQPVVEAFFTSTTGQHLSHFVAQRLAAGAVVYPPKPLRALDLTARKDVRVVILGQDPYHGPGQAEGLAFSVAPGTKPPPSLRNIFKELVREQLMPATGPRHGSLLSWAEQGVLLLNTSLTVEAGAPASHARQGWESLSDAVLEEVAKTAPACVYLLWGAHAQSKAALIRQTADTHGRAALLLQANHPSPLSALRPPVPFIGCGHFSAAQQWLAGHGITLDWTLP